MGKKHMLSMKKLENFILKEISHFKALKICKEGIHKFKFHHDWGYNNRLTCNKCNFEFRIPEDELKDYLIDRQPAKFWDDILERINDDMIQTMKEKFLPLMNNALELLNPKRHGEELIKTARNLLDSPLNAVLSELYKRSTSINRVKSKCKLGKHLLTYEDPQSSFLPNTTNKSEVLSDTLQSKGIWCRDCGQLILSMTEDRWQHFREGALQKIETQQLLIRRKLHQDFRKLEKYNWMTFKEKERFQELINSYKPSEREELLKFFTIIDENCSRAFFIKNEEAKIRAIQEHERIVKQVITQLMQEISSPEEIEIKQRLGQLKNQQSQLGRDLAALENLSYLYRIIKNVFWDDFSKDPHAFFQSEDSEREQWYNEVEDNIRRIRDQMKELGHQRDAILYPDSEEH